ncbi:MAG: ATP-NAD kinase-like domain-containing protein [Benjaminiella poitrasii]|nr:MAG: ATP-NAD kinase-like domain-containing protein [Benjaminiella poitrasii]
MNTSVRFEDTLREGRPSIYLFIFVNPLSGDCKGKNLIQLPIQHFRLRRFPQVQVEIHNILDEKDRELGIESVQLVESMAKMGKLPALDKTFTSESNNEEDDKEDLRISETVRTRHIHVWSAGGDGTVMSVFEMLVDKHVDLDYIFFSCIPLGTGNDFGQVLGWGRTIPHPNILGKDLRNLEELITERLQKSSAAHLDIWQVEMEAYPDGFVRQAGPERNDGHNMLEVDKAWRKQKTCPFMVRKMCNYMSIGVQGYVGSGFENHRTGNRWMNVMVYTCESAKWVFWRKFPSVSNFIEKIVHHDKTVLVCPKPNERKSKKGNASKVNISDPNAESVPIMTKQPIDFVIQNIPHIWGREVDLWGEATKGLESVDNRSGQTDPGNWTPQLANDGKMEIMAIQNMFSYLKKLANIRKHVSRIGQFESPFEIHFRKPAPPEEIKAKKWSTLFQNRYKKRQVICIMCDGEFYVLKNPKTLKFTRFARICTLGRNDGKAKARLVQDEQVSNKRKEKASTSIPS